MKSYLVKARAEVKRSEWEAGDTENFKTSEQAGRAELEKLGEQMAELQEVLYAEHKHAVLIVLQGI